MSPPVPSDLPLPRPPEKPDPQECCNRGCCPCIFDYYWDAYERWEKRVRELGHDPAEVLARLAKGTPSLRPDLRGFLNSRYAAFLALALAGVFWGLGFPLGKLALRETDAPHMVLLRFGVAALVSLPFALARREARALFRSPPVLLAGALLGVAFLVQFEGLAHVSVTLAALLVGAMPALIAVGARLLGERVSRASWAGVAAATLGAALIAGKPGEAGSPLGVALSLAALLIFLAWLYVLRRAPRPPTAMAIPAVTVIVAAATILPIALVMHGAPRLGLSPGAWAGIVGQGVLSTLLATAAWSFGSARLDSASAGVFINIEPLMGAALGVLLFGDRLSLALGFGGALILAGSLVVVLGERSGAGGEAPPVPPTPA